MAIPKHLISQINAQADLVGIIRRHTILKPAGKEFKGCCPFHGEKTPSFYVNPQTNLYHCFGCGVSGNAITFLVEYEKLSFIEAVKELAQKTGIELPKEDDTQIKYKRKLPNTQAKPQALNSLAPNHQTPNTQVAEPQLAKPKTATRQSSIAPALPRQASVHAPTTTQSQQQHPTPIPAWQVSKETQEGDLFELLHKVSQFYQAMLKQHPFAYDYFVARGLTKESIETFELGYAPSAWQSLMQAFPYDIEGLKILGLIRTSQKNGKDFDLLRNRVIFPIKDGQGQVVGFAGRTLDDTVQPKYINSTDSVVFKKQHILYGFYESRKQRAKDWLIVEGYMDVIALYQAGIYGAVAPMGTAVNENQIKNLLKFNDHLTLSFDGDQAGQKAALRTLEVAMPVLDEHKTLNFLVLPDNHDPDTFIKEKGSEAMNLALKQALPLSDFLYHIMRSHYDVARPEDKAKIMAEVKALTAKLPKGSSLRWWLNNDIYQRLKNQNSTKTNVIAQHAPSQPIVVSHQLLLCLIHSPELLVPDPLDELYELSGLKKIDERYANHLDIPSLPNWQMLGIEGISELVSIIGTLKPFLSDNKSKQSIDANAHMILSAISDKALQAQLSANWRDFIDSQRQHSTIAPLFFELLAQSVVQALKKEHSQCENLSLSQLYKKRLIALANYDRQVIKASTPN